MEEYIISMIDCLIAYLTIEGTVEGDVFRL